MSTPPADGFLARWSRRKALVREGLPVAEAPPPVPAPVAAPIAVPAAARPAGALAEGSGPEPAAAVAPPQPAAPAPPPLTLDDVAQLTPKDDFSRFVAPEVDSQVRNAALKTLFSDPHFNVMDGLDTYIEDYGQPDPLPPAMLRQLVQGEFLGLFPEERAVEKAEKAAAAQAAAPIPHEAAPHAAQETAHEDPDLRLQPDPAAGRTGPGPGPGEDAGRRDRGPADGSQPAVPP